MGHYQHDERGQHEPPSQHQAEPPPPGSGSIIPLRLRLMMLVPVIGISVAMACVGAMFIYYSLVFPDPHSMRPKGNGASIRILAEDGSLIADRGASRAYIPLDLIPKHVTDAVIATEDRRFFTHPGLDAWGLLRALAVNVSSGRLAQGGSTLTQQLAKNLFLTSERTLSRKAEEVVLALWLELKLSKRDILELYLNRVYLGAGAHGIEAAAQRYFGKSARDLTLTQGAVIAGLLKAPSKYAPSASREAAIARARVVLSRMREEGFITAEEETQARGDEVEFSSAMRAPDNADMAYAVDFVLDRAQAFTGGDQAEVVIETTLDAPLQRRAGMIIEGELQRNGARLAASQAALVVLAPDGGIRALVGGRSYAGSQFNRAVQARRQPGSTFKPVVYLTALEAGMTPDSIVQDEPIQLGKWAPKNDDDRYLGATTLRTALARSINTVAVRLVSELGAEKVAGTAERLGMKSVLRTDASLALGTSEVTLLDITGAYGAFGNGGYVNEPYIIRRIRTSDGRVLFTRLSAASPPAIAAKRVGQMNDMLRATLVSGTGRRAALSDHPAGGKTGTSQDFRDAWFIGYTAQFTAGVWVGNDDGTSMNKVMGGSLPAEIWRQVMIEAHRGRAPEPLPDGSAGMPPPAVAAIAPPRTERVAAPRIEEDFISRALDQTQSTAGDVTTAEGETVVDPSSGRIMVKPPVR